MSQTASQGEGGGERKELRVEIQRIGPENADDNPAGKKEREENEEREKGDERNGRHRLFPRVTRYSVMLRYITRAKLE